MGKKKRIRKKTVYICLEGLRESNFVNFLMGLYRPEENNINFTPESSSGGCPDKIVKLALNNSHRDKSFAWLDEDFEPHQPLSEDLRRSLAKCWNVSDDNIAAFLSCPLRDLQSLYNPDRRNPIVIVSSPVCVESVLLKALGKKPPVEVYNHKLRKTQIDTLKAALDGCIGKTEETSFYQKSLGEEKLNRTRKEVPQLDLLLSMFDK